MAGSAGEERGPSVLVAIPTFRRPEELRACLESVICQVVPGWEMKILVVDNDRARSAQEVVSATAAASAVSVLYAEETTAGVSAVRNKALRLGRDGDFLVFIDDDEVASGGWLANLLNAAEEFDAGVVQGRVDSVFPDDVPKWVRHCRAFNHPLPSRGSRLPFAASNNTLLRMSEIRARKIEFDLAFGETGGEDTDFFTRLSRTGVRIVACPEARVTERVVSSRLRFGWVFRRYVRTAAVWVRVERGHVAPPILWSDRLLSASWHFLCGIVGLVLLPLRGSGGLDPLLRHFGSGLGTIAGLFGYAERAYGGERG